MGEVILVASGKGGVGKTVFTANLGAQLALRQANVVVIDTNIGLRSMDICLGLEDRIIYDLTDVVTGTCRIKQALVKDRRFPDLYLMSAPQSKGKPTITPKHMTELCLELKKTYDYVLIDAPAGLDEGLLLSAAPADRAVIVTVPEINAIRDADLLDEMLNQMGIRNKSVVINKIMPALYQKGIVPDPSAISESLRLQISGLIPYDINIHISANIGVPIVLAKGSYIEQNFSAIANRILFKN